MFDYNKSIKAWTYTYNSHRMYQKKKIMTNFIIFVFSGLTFH